MDHFHALHEVLVALGVFLGAGQRPLQVVQNRQQLFHQSLVGPLEKFGLFPLGALFVVFQLRRLAQGAFLHLGHLGGQFLAALFRRIFLDFGGSIFFLLRSRGGPGFFALDHLLNFLSQKTGHARSYLPL